MCKNPQKRKWALYSSISQEHENERRNRKGEIRAEDLNRQLQKRRLRKINVFRIPYDGRASLSFMRDTSSYSATETTSSIGQIRPYSSQPCSITRGSDLWGSNMMLLGVTISTPPTTPCDNSTTHRDTAVMHN